MSDYFTVVAKRYLEAEQESRKMTLGNSGFRARIAAERALTGDPKGLAQHILMQERELTQAKKVVPAITPEMAAIAERLKGVAHIPITDETTGSKHYGYRIGVGNSELSSIWHCTEDREHPDHAAVTAEGGDVADLYCDSHYPTKDDNRALDFLLNARHDIQYLLSVLGIQVELKDGEE